MGDGSCSVRENIFLVKGPVNTALYDLGRREIYSINPLAAEILGLNGVKTVEGRDVVSKNKFSSLQPRAVNGEALDVLKGYLTRHPAMAQHEIAGGKGFSEGIIKLMSRRAGAPRLNFMWLELTNACNLSCTHCYAEAGESYANELSLTQWKEILEEGARLGAKKVLFTGGEPTLYPGLTDLVEHARYCQLKEIEVLTNATCLEDGILEQWAALGVKVALSFYSYNPETHDSITRKPGSFRRMVQGIKAILTHKIPVRVGILLMRDNFSHLEGTMEFLNGLGLKAEEIEYDYVRPTGRGVEEAALLGKNVCRKVSPSRTLPAPEEGQWACGERFAQDTCWKGRIAISSEGEIYPCVFARQLSVGRFPEMGLEEIVRGQGLQRLWQINLEEVETCKDCELRYGCFDCRALAQTTTGDLLSKNPRCQYNPYTGLMERDEVQVMKGKPKRRTDIVNEIVEDETIIYDPRNHNVHHLNPMAGVIWELCDGGHTPKEIAEEVVSALEADPVQVERDVTKTLEEFQRKGLLEGGQE